jgi:excisionase family DNA binding protein
MPAAVWFTPQQVADRLSVHRKTVIHWCRTGELHCLQLGRQSRTPKPRFRISEESLADFLATRDTVRPARRRRPRRHGKPLEFYK